ncbi:MAG: hypothetical protein J2P38_10105 [Candidatus Dormibacteraeota bacterium]|nr:hypothetical protein [Candidatus Dormibacteraeota bacterium]
MAGPTDIDKQIGTVRDSMESSIVVLRDRGKRELKRARKLALVAAGVGAAAGVIVVGLLVVQRLRRPPTRRERIERVIPLGWWDRLRAGAAKHVPPVRLYVGEQQVGEGEPQHRSWESSALHVAEAMATAVGTRVASTLVFHLLERLTRRGQEA